MTLIAAIKNRVRDLIPDFEGRVAAFPYMPSVDEATSRFAKRPYALIFPTGIETINRKPTETYVPATQKTLIANYDISVFFDPLLPGQEKTGEEFERLPFLLMDVFSNWKIEAGDICWLCDFGNWQPQVNTPSESIHSFSLAFTSRVDLSHSPDDVVQSLYNTASPVRIHVNGTIA